MSDDRIAKLPQWVQEHIKKLKLERDAAVRQLNEFVDAQKESPIYVEELVCTGEQKGPSIKRRYIHSRSVHFGHGGVSLTVHLDEPNERIALSWSGSERWSSRHACFVPTSFQQAELISKENMR